MSTSVSNPADPHSVGNKSQGNPSQITGTQGQRPANRGKAADNRKARLWVTLAATVLFVIVGFLVIRTQGYVSGSEFSPSHFQKRDFSFYEIPLIHLQITPIKRSGTTPETAVYLRQTGLIPAATGNPDVWHLVTIQRGLTGRTPADAQLLTDQLELNTGSNPYWKQWCTDHPKLARELWPTIQKLADRELYILMPRMLEIAQNQPSIEALQTEIDKYLKREYAGLIADLKETGRNDLAEALRQEASRDYPGDPAF
ncbi:hypothetical protein Poly51_28080 [Rubripirellula tenax]|uniref:Uncharacterized protein n=1 Tax=Rubripirellula tenax TaxID=2528015 RepID=A0A5C6F8F3_9BACT|nr:hypothetical protein [Rubripirellula tenax]TWU56890.1 hypothetical protein Poly51_28080 [Rubripirellula tenax]